jgi:competence protein ComEC
VPKIARRAGFRSSPYLHALTGYTPPFSSLWLGSIYGVASALVVGDALGNLGYWPGYSWILWAVALVAISLFLCRKTTLGLVVTLLALTGAASLSAGKLSAPDRSALSIRHYPEGAQLALEGLLWREPERSYGTQRLMVKLERASRDGVVWQPCTGLLRATLLEPGNYLIGQRLRLSGRLRFPRNYGDPGEFDYEAYMARAGIAATALIRAPAQITVVDYHPWFPWSQIEHVRAHIARFIDATLDYPAREEARALVIGDRGGLGDQIRDNFALTAMTHLLVISGLHMGFVAAVAFMLARVLMLPAHRLLIFGLANKIAAIAAGLTVVAYALIAGHHVSTIRAVIMVIAYALAVVFDRSNAPLAAMATAAAAIILALPGSTADIGFQLSFATVASIVLGMRRYSAWWFSWCERRMLKLRPAWPVYRMAGWLGGYLALSCYAAAGVSALTAYHFNQFSLIGPLANAVVIPIMGLAGTLGALCACVLSFLAPVVAAIVLRAAGWFLNAGTYLASCFVVWPAAWMRCFTPTFPELLIFYGLLLLWLLRPIHKSEFRSGATVRHAARPSTNIDEHRTVSWHLPAAGLLLFALAIDGAWWSYERFFNPALRIIFLAVGEGDAAVIRFPGSEVMVLDGGGNLSQAFDPGERLVARYLWSQKVMHVDYLALSHPDFDHYGGLIFLARNFRPRVFWAPDVASPDAHYAALLTALALSGARLRLLNSSTAIGDIGGVALRCLNPPPRPSGMHNDNSMVLTLARGAYRVLFTGDIEARAEQDLLATSREEIRATLLKVPHHGSITSSTPAFVEAVRPQLAIISVGHLNRFHFPAAVVIQRYTAAGARILRTDEDGAIAVEIEDDRMRVRTTRATADGHAELIIRHDRLHGENG